MANYLFYTSLVTHFLEAVLKFVHIDPEAVLQMTYKVCIVLSLLLRKYVAVPYQGNIIKKVYNLFWTSLGDKPVYHS